MVTQSTLAIARNLRVVDGFVAVATMVGSFALRLDAGPTFVYFAPQVLAATVIAIVVKPVIYHFAGLYRPHWAYVAFGEVLLIQIAVSVSSLAVAAISLGAYAAGLVGAFPRSILVLDWLFTLACITGLRILARHGLKVRERARNPIRIRRVRP